MSQEWKSSIDRLVKDQKGVTGAIMAFGMTAAVGMTGLVTQETILYQTKSALQSSADLAALAGAQNINVGAGGTAISTATSYSAVTGDSNAISGQTVTMATGYPQLKCLTSISVPCTGPDSANAIVVKEQATVPLIFGKLLGMSSTTLTVTSTAAAGGGSTGSTGTTAKPVDVMLIIDATSSMNDSDTECSVSGATRETCAEAGARALLQALVPPTSGSTNTGVEVGLMVFPGLSTATESAYTPYNCSTGPKPTNVAYSAPSPAPVYQIIPLSSDYKTSPTATSLNTSSNLVRAVQGGPSGCQQGIDALGGYGTYYAGVITAAQTALTTTGRSGSQKVVIILSDGGANAKSTNVPSGMASNQCHEAITAAEAVTAAGTWVFSAAYGSSTATGSQSSSSPSTCTTDSPIISACATMQGMASTPAMFFSDSSGGSTVTCNSTISANNTTDLVALFTSLGNSLVTYTHPRLLPNGTT